MNWFESQSKLLQDINWAAGIKRVPSSLKAMINLTENLDLATNWSRLHDCSYRLENKTMVLYLDFSLPKISEQVEILKVLPISFYDHRTVNENDTTVCWNTYTGPGYVLHNKTNNCVTGLHEDRVYQLAVRSQTCSSQRDELSSEESGKDLWKTESCSPAAPRNESRIQIYDINGVHKIYCYPFEIKIEGATLQCPNGSFALEGHANYKISGIIHSGEFVDRTVARQLRKKRSALIKPESSTPPSTLKTLNITALPSISSRINITETLRSITGKMDKTLTSIKEHLKKFPGSLNITKYDFDTLFSNPLELIIDGYEGIINMIKAIGVNLGVLGALATVILIMPIVEVLIIGLRIARVPVRLWLGSACRVTTEVKKIPATLRKLNIKDLFKVNRKRWDENIKLV